jgi:hypothetical protein
MKRIWLVAGVALAAAALIAAAALGAFARGHGSKSAAGDRIAVHGNWKIVVKNPDGRVARVLRFHNAFNGANLLARVFAHQSTPGRFWLLVADNGGLNNPCQITSGTSTFQVSCNDFESDDPNAGAAANFFGNLAASVNGSNEIVVTGDITAQRDGQFDRVLMRSSSCANATAPSACHPNGYVAWSDRTLSSPVTLVNGQHALITVTYTFTAAP